MILEPFHTPDWIYEENYDGCPILAYKERKRVRFLSRNGRDWADRFAEIVRAIASLPVHRVVLDGEVVVFDNQLVSRLDLLQDRASRLIDCVFDCLIHSSRRRGRLPGHGES